MYFLRFIFCIFLFSSLNGSITKNALPITQVVIWGHKLHSHTHSYVHEGFYRGFLELGYKTMWFDDADTVSAIDFSNSLFITEGQVDKNIPIRTDCFYILHNCASERYHKVINVGRCIELQKYTRGCDAGFYDIVQEEPYISTSISGKIIFMPWATDLLPVEIDPMKSSLVQQKRKNKIFFVGTITGTIYGNQECIISFMHACDENYIPFSHGSSYFGACRPIEREEHITLVQESLFAPIIVGPWQKEVGYLPCRAFKNVSYGQYPVTNSREIYELFSGHAIFNEDTYQLFYDAVEQLPLISTEEMLELMNFVQEKHTYLNRIEHILNFFSTIYRTAQQKQKYK